MQYQVGGVAKQTNQGFACIVKENKKSSKKYGEAVGRGRSRSGRNHRVHLDWLRWLQIPTYTQNTHHILDGSGYIM